MRLSYAERTLRRLSRAARMVALRQLGPSYAAIGRLEGLSPQYVWTQVEAYARLARRNEENVVWDARRKGDSLDVHGLCLWPD
jgi:hypothetical protein